MLYTAAYWLMLTVRDAIAKPQPLAVAEFATLRMRLIDINGRISETATRVRIAFAAAYPEAELSRAAPALCNHPGHDERSYRPDPPRLTNPGAYQLRAEIARFSVSASRVQRSKL